jgi:hypothetical protein
MTKLLVAILIAVPAIASAQVPDGDAPAPPPVPEPAPSPPPPPPPAVVAPAPVAPALPPPAVLATTPAATDHASGLALGVSLELAEQLVGDSAAIPSAATRLLVGYQAGPVLFGATFDLQRVSVSASEGGESASQTQSTIAIGPVVRVTLAQSETGATELLAAADLSYRTFSMSTSGSESSNTPEGYTLTTHIGPSIRHWLSPNFAVAATTAVRMDDFAPPSGSSSFLIALATSIDLLGVF